MMSSNRMNLGSQLKAKGQEIALANSGPEWVDEVSSMVRNWAVANKRFYVEDFRAWYEGLGGTPPASHNSWGGLTRRFKSMGFKRTGKFRASQRPSAHARIVFEWEAE